LPKTKKAKACLGSANYLGEIWINDDLLLQKNEAKIRNFTKFDFFSKVFRKLADINNGEVQSALFSWGRGSGG